MPLAIASLPRQLVYVTALELGGAAHDSALSVRLVRDCTRAYDADARRPRHARRIALTELDRPPGSTLSQATLPPPPGDARPSGAWESSSTTKLCRLWYGAALI
jgi:hypothetical protein